MNKQNICDCFAILWNQFEIVNFPNQNECTRNVDRLSVIFLSKLLNQAEKENNRFQFQFYIQQKLVTK